MLFSFSSLLLVASALCLIHGVDFDKARRGNGRLYSTTQFLLRNLTKPTEWAFKEKEKGEKKKKRQEKKKKKKKKKQEKRKRE